MHNVLFIIPVYCLDVVVFLFFFGTAGPESDVQAGDPDARKFSFH